MNSESKITLEMVQLVKRSRFNPIRTLTPEVLSRQLDSFATGYLREFALTSAAIKKRDDVISVALPKREKAVSRRNYTVLFNEGLPEEVRAQAEKHKKALQYFFDNCTATDALDMNQRGGFRLLSRQMMEAVGFRYAVHEIVWEPRIVQGAPALTAKFTYVPLQFFENITGRLRFLSNGLGGVEGQEMKDDEWLVTVGDGIMEALSVAYMFKQMSLKDWISFNEKFGMPGLHGKTNAPKNSDAWNALVAALQDFSQEFAAVTNEDATINLIETKSTGSSLPFPPLVERMDKVIATICRGADLSTLSAGQGQGQGASLQGDESELLEQDDAAMISETLQHISRIVIRYLFGEETPLAYVQVVVPKKKNLTDTRANIKLLVDAGVPVGQEWARAELGVPAPAKDEPVLNSSTRVAPPQLDALDLANAAEAGREAIFKAEAASRQLAARRPVFRPIAERLAGLLAVLDDPEKRRAAAESFRAQSSEIYRDVVAKAPDLAKPAEQAIGTALVDGWATAAESRNQPATK